MVEYFTHTSFSSGFCAVMAKDCLWCQSSTTECCMLTEYGCFKILSSWGKDCLLRGILVISGIHVAAYQIISVRVVP